MKNSYKYKICALCKKDKEENRSPYCNPCGKEYGRNYRMIKKLKPNVNMEGLGAFIKKIERANYYIDFNDMLVILFFYEIITKNINEYDQYNSGKQIYLMWKRINNYYCKRVKEKNNI
jgi:hypothetical protein